MTKPIGAGTIKVATCGFPATGDVTASLAAQLAYLDEAGAAGADLVVFPEAALQGYIPDFGVAGFEASIRFFTETAESVPDGPSVQAMIERAKQLGVHVVFGLTELGERPGVLYNTLVLAGPSGYVGKYRKVHLAVGERVVWREGDEWPVFDTPIGKIGMLTCYDKMWPESTRELVLQGAELLIMGTAWPMMEGHGEGAENLWVRQYQLFDRVRAAENGRWFISSNLVGELGGMNFFGLSNIVDPHGDIIATSGLNTPGLAYADIDVAGGIFEAMAANQGSFLIRDRRPETYRVQNGTLPVNIDG